MADADQSVGTLNLAFVEELYADYLQDPTSVPESWKKHFDEIKSSKAFKANPQIKPAFESPSLFNPRTAPGNGKHSDNGYKGSTVVPPDSAASVKEIEVAYLQDKVDQLIRAYRIRGHMIAQLDPLGMPRPHQRELDPNTHGLLDEDLDRMFSSNTIYGTKMLPLREILERLRQTYCRSIGVQFMHIDDYAPKKWLMERMEATQNRLDLSPEEQIRILTRLTDAVMFEEFIQKKFLGSKSFSLEGAESLIPLLDMAIERAGEHGMNEIVIGMAHRGRLNVLANIMHKSPREIFREFEDIEPDVLSGRGDVKYHLGYHNDWMTQSGKEVHLALCFNPSHLEFVNPVALGRVRAKQDRLQDTQREKYMALLIHGDAAFAGEGVVQETLNLSELKGYSTGGTIHVVVNNQVGFTTNPTDGRSGVYATDIARMLQVPIFHVNGEDPEAVAQVVKLSMDFRQTFKRDVVIDMYCYRRRGHNEGDEPSFTQPMMYKQIERKKSVRDSYLDHLLKLGDVTKQQADEIAEARRRILEDELSNTKNRDENAHPPRPSILGRVWKNYTGGPDSSVPEAPTSIKKERLSSLLNRLAVIPEDFIPHPKIERILENRREMADGKRELDWSAAEALAFATLVTDGVRVRISGQDVERGTFSHRHAVLHDYTDGHTCTPLQRLSSDQAAIELYNSPLSEAGVLGYEYGYSVAYPDGLVIWEAQFGDFWNAAQVIVDQFITSAEDKWRSLTGLVMLLPHGFEGMGPEHSSARLERFMTLAAEDNMQICQPTTPSQMFHLLRRQVLRPWRKPLVVMTPKSLLRHPDVISPVSEFTSGSFQRIIPDTTAEPGDVTRILLCSGKIFYELDRQRRESGRDDVAIIRMEQLYPLNMELFEDTLRPYHDDTPVIWVQEEPENMGAWRYLHERIGYTLFGRLPFSGISRPESASPATGSANAHKAEQKRVINRAFGESYLVSEQLELKS